jgi:hypothetical protein
MWQAIGAELSVEMNLEVVALWLGNWTGLQCYLSCFVAQYHPVPTNTLSHLSLAMPEKPKHVVRNCRMNICAYVALVVRHFCWALLICCPNNDLFTQISHKMMLSLWIFYKIVV